MDNFQSQNNILNKKLSLQTLINQTNGNLFSFILGLNPKHQKIRLTKTLINNLTSKIATRCVLRLRTSMGYDIIDDERFIDRR